MGSTRNVNSSSSLSGCTAQSAQSDNLQINKQPKQKQHRVRFCDESSNQIFTYDAIPHELFSELFWSSADQDRIRHQQRRFGQECVTKLPQLIDCIYFLHGLDYQNRCRLAVDAPDSYAFCQMSWITLAVSEGRGLERYFTPFLCNHQHFAIDKILSFQQQEQKQQLLQQQLQQQQQLKLQQSSNENAPEQQQQQQPRQLSLLLRQWSVILSEMPTRYAQFLAQGDAMVAAMYQNEPAATMTSPNVVGGGDISDASPLRTTGWIDVLSSAIDEKCYNDEEDDEDDDGDEDQVKATTALSIRTPSFQSSYHTNNSKGIVLAAVAC